MTGPSESDTSSAAPAGSPAPGQALAGGRPTPPVLVATVAPNAPVTTTELRFLDPTRLEFFRDGAALRVTLTDEFSVLDARVVRVFPLSDPDRHLSLRDAKGNEIGVLCDPSRLPAATRRLVEEALARRYFLPVITRIVSARDRHGTTRWKVETDHGPMSFLTRNLREEVIAPALGRYLLKDLDGNRYDVPQVGALDAASQGLLQGRL
jgi:hypothetical protein